VKLRIQDNSVRLRLRKSELDDFARTGKVEAETIFAPGSVLRYSLEAADISSATATFENSWVRIVVPKPQAEAWTSGNETGIAAEHAGISILVEKDYQRTNVKSKIDYDLYPNPRSPQPR
jgi:hypothetical protein